MFVDTFGAICDNAALSQNMVSEWHEIFEGLGEALGTQLDGHELSSRVTSKRFWMLRQGLAALLRRRRCSCRALERLIGHCTFMGLASQRTLCSFHTSCRHWTLFSTRVSIGIGYVGSEIRRHWRPRVCLKQHSEEQDSGFEEVPWSLLRRSRWKHVRKGTLRYSEDSSQLEARAMVLNIRRLARTQDGCGTRQLFSVTIWGFSSILNNSGYEQCCTPRSSFEDPGEQSSCNEVTNTPPTEFYIGSSMCRRGSCWPRPLCWNEHTLVKVSRWTKWRSQVTSLEKPWRSKWRTTATAPPKALS